MCGRGEVEKQDERERGGKNAYVSRAPMNSIRAISYQWVHKNTNLNITKVISHQQVHKNINMIVTKVLSHQQVHKNTNLNITKMISKQQVHKITKLRINDFSPTGAQTQMQRGLLRLGLSDTSHTEEIWLPASV